MKLHILHIVITVLLCGVVKGQDLHWTQFDLPALQLNPARTGDFEGTARLTGIIRSQSGSIASTGFTSYGFSVDLPIIRGLRERDWVGVGISFAADQAGALELGIQSQAFSGSYHFSLHEKKKSYITLGVQVESYGRRLRNAEAAEWATPQQTVLQSGDWERGTAYAGGLQLTTPLTSRTKIRVGGKVGRIGSLDLRLFQGSGGNNNSDNELPTRMTLHGDVEHRTGPKTKVLGALVWEDYGSANITMLQGKYKMLLNQKRDIDLSLGLGYRLGDAGQVLVGVGIGDIDIGIAYDLVLSSQAPEAVPLGGLEVGLAYIFKKYPEAKVDPVIFCPRF